MGHPAVGTVTGDGYGGMREFSTASSQAFMSWVAANHPRRPGTRNIGMGRRPALRARDKASVVPKPNRRAVSAELRIGALGK